MYQATKLHCSNGAGTIGYTGPDCSAELGAGNTKAARRATRRYSSGKPDRKREIYVLGSYGYGPHCKREQAVYSFAVGSATQLTAVSARGGPDACGV